MKKDEKKVLVDFFNEVSDEYTEAKKKVREAGLEIIKAAVKKHEGQLSLTEIYEENGHEEVVSVTYDGGNQTLIRWLTHFTSRITKLPLIVRIAMNTTSIR